MAILGGMNEFLGRIHPEFICQLLPAVVTREFIPRAAFSPPTHGRKAVDGLPFVSREFERSPVARELRFLVVLVGEIHPRHSYCRP